MPHKKWLLDIGLVRLARHCSLLVNQEYGKRLPLAHSDFLGQIEAYAEESDSLALKKATRDLLNGIVDFTGVSSEERLPEEEMTTYMGKQYPRWHEGREFSGLYRGAPVYRDTEDSLNP